MMKLNKKIAIGGMIGAGKSTLSPALADKLGYAHLEEFNENDNVFKQMLQWLYEGKNIELQLQTYFIEYSYNVVKQFDRKTKRDAYEIVCKENEEMRGALEHNFNLHSQDNNVVVDRDIIEHWLFAHINLKDSDPALMTMYNNLFHAYYLNHQQPDLYVILDINWETFKNRLFTRGRAVEVDNFEENKAYFKNLLDNYTSKLTAQCIIYDVPFVVIDCNGKEKEDVLKEVYEISSNIE